MIIKDIKIVSEWKHLEVRLIKDDGSYHRTTILCGDFDMLDDYGVSADDIWTEELISSYNEMLNNRIKNEI